MVCTYLHERRVGRIKDRLVLEDLGTVESKVGAWLSGSSGVATRNVVVWRTTERVQLESQDLKPVFEGLKYFMDKW